jgi:hypothetical protein
MRKLTVSLLVVVLLATVVVVPASATPPITATGWFYRTGVCPGYDQRFEIGDDIVGYLCANVSMARSWDALFNMTIDSKSGECEGVVVVGLTKPKCDPPSKCSPNTNGYAQIHSNTCTANLAGLHLHASFDFASGKYSARYHFDP